MKRRTSALSVSAAALLLAAPLLTGCAGDTHPGAAAVVGGERITISEVQSRAAAVREAQRATAQGDILVEETPALQRQMLGLMIFHNLVEQAAEDAGVVVTNREVQQERAALEEQFGGPEGLAEVALVGQNVPLTEDQIDGQLRVGLMVAGIGGGGEEGNDRVYTLLSSTAEEIGVEVNPRYGTWDVHQLGLVDAEVPWLRGPSEDADTLGG
ncbi:SurA N-terminal domain-containing protein [Streptomyces sp. ST2-7A]|uniref:SurA N-terminal domain-containing protein n=1 Tax=Streptomyces sp. ST2-7A TaxID=2907214 RepID=UPI001F39925A|nr:SurA N-terminal domain-containing protein [Streptomyces sp. ST2-7A]MCE7081401.1 SurA N-terminal domain-containing protein [Streptomyces sp. ST2-7A]